MESGVCSNDAWILLVYARGRREIEQREAPHRIEDREGMN